MIQSGHRPQTISVQIGDGRRAGDRVASQRAHQTSCQSFPGRTLFRAKDAMSTAVVSQLHNHSLVDGTQWSPLHCSKDALTDTYGWFLQVLLAGLAFTCLIGKRFCEPRYSRRSWLVWFYDTSKQGMGAFIIHMANVWLASQFTGDPCTWYIINFMLDSTLGLLIIWAGIRIAQALSRSHGFYLINFGEYGKPASACAWGCQCALYALIMIVMKASIGVAVWFLDRVGVTRFVLSPVTDPKLELAVIMLIIPFFVNILMFWVTDNFLMYRPHPDNTKIKTKVRYRSIKKEKSGSESEEISADERLLSTTA